MSNFVWCGGGFVASQAIQALSQRWIGLDTRAAQYVVSTVKVVGLGSFALLEILSPRPGAHDQIAASLNVVTVYLGYLLHDCYQSRRVWLSHPGEILHHILAICLGAVILSAHKYLEPVIINVPNYLLCEWSTLFLNLRYFLAAAHRRESVAYRLSSLAFAALFLVLRLGWAPWVSYCIVRDSPEVFMDSRLLKGVVALAHLLQGYWGAQIIAKVVR